MYSAFPTGFIRWGDGYEWEGTLLTTVGGSAECVVAPSGGSTAAFSSFPQPPVTTPTPGSPERTPDPRGLEFEAVPVVRGMEDAQQFFGAEDALKRCSTFRATFRIGYVPTPNNTFVTVSQTTTVGGGDDGPHTPPTSPDPGPEPEPQPTSRAPNPSQSTEKVTSKLTGNPPSGDPRPGGSVGGNPLPSIDSTTSGLASPSFYSLAGFYNLHPFVSLLLLTMLLSTLVAGVVMLAGM